MNEQQLLDMYPELYMYTQAIHDKLTEKKYRHSLGVMVTASGLIEKYQGSQQEHRQAVIAGILHDIAKCMKEKEMIKRCHDMHIGKDVLGREIKELMHAPLGAEIVKKDYLIEDETIINAIRYHTTGRAGMSLVEKVVFLSDFIEPDRVIDHVEEVRALAHRDLDEAVVFLLDLTIRYLIGKGQYIHCDTFLARNSLLGK